MVQAVAFHSDRHDSETWRRIVQERHPDLEWRVWPDGIGDPEEIVFSLIRRPPKGELARYPNLKGIFSFGAGVEHLLGDADLPKGVPIVRLVDPTLARGVVLFVVERVLHLHREFHRYRALQDRGAWRALCYPEARDRRIGVLGPGTLGGEAARWLVRLGFPVAGWSRSPKTIEGMESFVGADALMPFLARTDILVCVLPLTAATAGIVNARTLAALPEGASLINVGRGAHVVDADLIAALDSGRLAWAALDVFRTEPLPADDPYWRHPRVLVTPHAAGRARGDASPRAVAQDMARLRAGRPARLTADPARGY